MSTINIKQSKILGISSKYLCNPNRVPGSLRVIVNNFRHCLTTMASNEETIWSFGYGSNMDVKALEAKKHVKVIGKYFNTVSSTYLYF